MLIADVEKEDIKNCLDIYNYYIQNTVYTLEEAPLTLSEFSARVKEISKNFPYIVAKNERGEAIGYAYLNYFNERSAYRITANLSVYVAPDGRGKGTGAALKLSPLARVCKGRRTQRGRVQVRQNRRRDFFKEKTVKGADKNGKLQRDRYIRTETQFLRYDR